MTKQPVSGAMAPVGLVLGDRIPDFDEVIMPRLNIVQNIGDLKDSFPLGAIVFNQSAVIFTAPIVNKTTGIQEKAASAPVIVTCLGFRPDRFVEKVQGGRGMIVNTEDQVLAAGGTLDYNEAKLKAADGIKYFERLAEGLFAIERPEIVNDDGTVFVYPVDGKKYALAMWGMKGTAYTAAAKRVFFTNRSMGCLREGGYPSRSFALTTRWKSFGEQKGAHVPVLLPHLPSSPAFLEWVKQVLNPAASPVTGAE